MLPVSSWDVLCRWLLEILTPGLGRGLLHSQLVHKSEVWRRIGLSHDVDRIRSVLLDSRSMGVDALPNRDRARATMMVRAHD